MKQMMKQMMKQINNTNNKCSIEHLFYKFKIDI